MPIYEFECLVCGEKFETLVRGAGQEVSCPACKSLMLKRLFSVFAFVSKGSDGESSAGSSSCAGCTATSCATCRR